MKKYLSLAMVVAVLFAVSCSNESAKVSNKKANRGIQGTVEDEKAIEIVYQNWYKAWETKDYKLAAQDYSDDAVWVNAFGMKRTGRAEIEKTLKEVFAMDFVMSGKSKTVEKTIKFLRRRIALVTSRVEREGQETADEKKMETRKTSHLRVFVKSKGKWKIVNHLISDARSTERPEH